MECELCKSEHDGKYGSGRFCSQKCARSFSSGDEEHRKIKNKKTSETLKRKKSKYHYKKGKDHHFYGKHHSEETKEKIRKIICGQSAERIANTKFEDLTQNNQKQRLLEENNHKCMECGQEEIWNSKHLDFEFHHKDGNRKNKSRENCEVICPNCHSQTDNYKFRNKKHTKEDIEKSLRNKKRNKRKLKKVNTPQ